MGSSHAMWRGLLPSAIGVVLLACSSGAGVEPERADVASTTSDPAGQDDGSPGPAIVDGAANSLILVHDQDGGERSLVSYRTDGSEAAVYSDTAGDVVWQPVWSPDGRRVAWTRSGDGANWSLVTAAVAGDDRTEHVLPGRPDYITYDPTSSRVLALTPSIEGFGMVVVDVTDGTDDTPAVIDIGQPYFSDFAPDGERVVAHVGPAMRTVDLNGDRTSLGAVSASHQTPAWHPTDLDVVFFTADADGVSSVVAHRPSDGDTIELATFSGFASLDVDPAGERLAVVVFGGGGTPVDDDTPQAVGPRQRTVPRLDAGLWTIDLADGTVTQLDEEPSTAPMWDPTGRSLLVRTPVAGAAQWVVFGVDGSRTATDEFAVTGTLAAAYLPFWDQYARSQTLWSPSGEQFVHVGTDAAGTSGVWVHDASSSGPSVFVADGDVAFWSPT